MGRSLTTPPDLRASSRLPSQMFGTSVSVPLLAGDRGTAQTIDLIRQAVNDGLSNPTVRATAAQALRGVPAFQDHAAARAIFNWVKGNIRFTQDPVGHETVSSADWTIRHGIGDCDDINAVLLPALLMVVGYNVRLVTVNDDPTDPAGEFTHVYSEVWLDGRWVPVDAARPGAQFGSTVSRAFRKRVWSLTSKEYQDMAGYRGLNGVGVCRGCSGCRGVCGRAGMSGWLDSLTDIISQGSQAAGNIITAFRIPPQQIFTSGQQAAPPPGTAASPMAINPVLLLGGFGLLAAVMIGKK